MKYSKVVIKIKEQGKTWEETPIAAAPKLLSDDEASALCQNVANSIKKEVRWNWIWSNQGHYHFPE